MKYIIPLAIVALIAGLSAACGGAPPAPDSDPAATEIPDLGEPEVEATPAELEPSDETVRARLQDIAAMDHRSDDNRHRDQYRNPVETLAFFGITPDLTVLELYPGGGWYTEILAPFLAGSGQLIVGNYNPDGEPDAYVTTIARNVVSMLEDNAEVYGHVQHEIFIPGTLVTIEDDGSVDMVLSFRNAHGWARRGVTDEVFAEIHRVLAPGGTFGLVTHRAAEDDDPEQALERGYLRESDVIAAAERAGFVLDARSDVNANPADTRDHPEGVWTLPPTLRLGDENRDHWLAIGESDRMTLRFLKPAE